MKIYQATIVANNSAYVETLLIVAENEVLAHKQLCDNKKRQVTYTQQLKELKIDMKKPNVIEYVGWGHCDTDRYE